MKVAGFDSSSYAIDCVTIEEDDGVVEWSRWDLRGSDAWERTRSIGSVMPGRTSERWDDVYAIGVEVAHGPSSGVINRCVGAVLSMLPPNVLICPWTASQWKKAVGLPGNATKAQIASHAAAQLGFEFDQQDAYDAWGLARATQLALESKRASP